MPLARIITPTHEDALPLADRLQSHGYTVQIVGPGEACEEPAELEIELDKMQPYQALAHAARLSRGKQVSVFVAPGCLEAPQSEPEAAPVSQQLLDAAEEKRYEPSLEVEPAQLRAEEPPMATLSREFLPKAKRSSRNDLWAELRAAAEEIGAHARQLFSRVVPALQWMRAAAALGLQSVKQKSSLQRTHLAERWTAQRQRREMAAQQRREAKIGRLRMAELERARHLLEQQEEHRREAIHKRLAEEERAKQRLIETQLRRVREAEEEERRQIEREAQLERQRHEALRLAEERERVARERSQRERLAEEARRMRAEEAERRRREKEEQVLLQRKESLPVAQERGTKEMHPPLQQPAAEEPAVPAAGNWFDEAENSPAPQIPEEQVPVETVAAYAHMAQSPRSRIGADLNSPYHPGWTWAAAAAGAATVAIMLLWTAVSASRSAVHFEALSPSSLLPPRASQIQQQVPFGPVKVIVQKSGSAPAVKVVAAGAPISAAPVAAPAPTEPRPQTVAKAKPSAAKNQVSPESSGDAADSGPEVVVRHFTAPVKAVPQAGQTATVKHYSDMN